MTEPVLSVQHLYVDYVTESGLVPACADVSLDIRPGEILGIAGESGSGKSTLLTAMGRLQRSPAVTSGGRVMFGRPGQVPVDLAGLDERELSEYRWTDISIVMQSAMACLNPVLRLRDQFVDVIKKHAPRTGTPEAVQRARGLLDMTGVPPDRLASYPHELSGGMQQRALIALAMACEPALVLMDEPTTAVDVIMQHSLLRQVLQLQREHGFAIAFVTHDLSLLMEIADRIAIMYAGRIVEVSTPERLYDGALHPYSRGLRDAFPPLSGPIREMAGIPGAPPDLQTLPPGCAFAPRCPLVEDRCHESEPVLTRMDGDLAACHVARREWRAATGGADEVREPTMSGGSE